MFRVLTEQPLSSDDDEEEAKFVQMILGLGELQKRLEQVKQAAEEIKQNHQMHFKAKEMQKD